MTVLQSVDFFPSGAASVTIEPRLPQAAFPEHHHDFNEIVIVEHGTGIHVFNGQPHTICGGTVCDQWLAVIGGGDAAFDRGAAHIRSEQYWIQDPSAV